MYRRSQGRHVEVQEGLRGRDAWRHGRLCFVGLLACALPFLHGCTFWAFSGGGPMGRQEAYQLVGRAPQQMTASEKEQAVKLYEKARGKSGFPESKDRVSTRTSLCKAIGKAIITLGSNLRIEAVALEKPGRQEDCLYLSDRGFIPGYPFLWPWWSEWTTLYSLGTGEELGQTKLHGLGLGTCLGGYACQVFPERKDKRLPVVPSSLGQEYNVKTAYHGLFGAFAKGRVNHKEYLQLLWIPIPLGLADD